VRGGVGNPSGSIIAGLRSMRANGDGDATVGVGVAVDGEGHRPPSRARRESGSGDPYGMPDVGVAQGEGRWEALSLARGEKAFRSTDG
jgi:hypothetical protein